MPRSQPATAESNLPKPHSRLTLAHRSAEAGLPRRDAMALFQQLATASATPVGPLRSQIIPDSSWKRGKDRLTASASQTAARLVHIFHLAESVWGNRSDAAEWLSNPHAELEGKTPYSLLRTESGGRVVEALLVALDEGFPV